MGVYTDRRAIVQALMDTIKSNVSDLADSEYGTLSPVIPQVGEEDTVDKSRVYYGIRQDHTIDPPECWIIPEECPIENHTFNRLKYSHNFNILLLTKDVNPREGIWNSERLGEDVITAILTDRTLGGLSLDLSINSIHPDDFETAASIDTTMFVYRINIKVDMYPAAVGE